MRVKIYQIDFERDKGRAKFLDMEGLEKFTHSSKVDPDIYQEVFNGELDPMGLEDIYVQFNREGHPLHRGHSMSVSDVVVIDSESVLDSDELAGRSFCFLMGLCFLVVDL